MKRKLELLLLLLIFGFPLFARQGARGGSAVSIVQAGFARKLPVIDDPKTLIINDVLITLVGKDLTLRDAISILNKYRGVCFAARATGIRL